jgi:hypothetical protein
VVVIYFKVLLQHFNKGIEENKENPGSAPPIFERDSNQEHSEHKRGTLST